jgi:hypothetical protein
MSMLLFYFYYRIAAFYLATSREVKRIESISSSPIYAQFGETLTVMANIIIREPLQYGLMAPLRKFI